jgi:hypothetical protein
MCGYKPATRLHSGRVTRWLQGYMVQAPKWQQTRVNEHDMPCTLLSHKPLGLTVPGWVGRTLDFSQLGHEQAAPCDLP